MTDQRSIRWEYSCVIVENGHVVLADQRTMKAGIGRGMVASEAANHLGSLGWEMVNASVYPTNMSNATQYLWFKRPS